MSPPSGSTKRDRLVEVALDLFSREGIRATGIDRILAEAGVAKMTLYKHFRSKDELVLAALRRKDERTRNVFAREVERRARAPRDRLLAIFDVLASWCGAPDYTGCVFVAACSEFHDREDPVRAAATEHKRLLGAYVRELAAAAGAREPSELAEQLVVLMEGAQALANVRGDAEPVRTARRAAEVLLSVECPPEPAVAPST